MCLTVSSYAGFSNFAPLAERLKANVAHLKLIFCSEALGRLLQCLAKLRRFQLVSTYMFLPPAEASVSTVYLQHSLETHASRCPSGMLASTLLMSWAPKPVTVRLCLGRLMPCGAIGPCSSETGALEDRVLSRVLVAIVAGEKGQRYQGGIRKVWESVGRGRQRSDPAGR